MWLPILQCAKTSQDMVSGFDDWRAARPVALGYINPEQTFSPDSVLQAWDRSGHRRIALAFHDRVDNDDIAIARTCLYTLLAVLILVKCWALGGERERVRVYIHVHTRSSCASAEAHRAAHRARLLSRSLWFRRLRLLSLSSGVSLARLSRSCCLRRSSLVWRSLSCCSCTKTEPEMDRYVGRIPIRTLGSGTRYDGCVCTDSISTAADF